jgi:hypothetical protein
MFAGIALSSLGLVVFFKHHRMDPPEGPALARCQAAGAAAVLVDT